MRQERAERTRQALVVAAANEFDRHGFTGTPLSQISKAAEMTMGALSFHFPSKMALAVEVCAQGSVATREALDRVMAAPRPGLAAVVDLTVELVRLLERDVRPRAFARLSREAVSELPSWNSLWLTVMRELLHRTPAAQGLASDLRGMELLMRYLMAGAEASIREGGASGAVVDELRDVWTMIGRGLNLEPLPGVGSDGLQESDRPDQRPAGTR
ncbi:TetR family transcriptional regulator [Streptomyces sp. NPDC001381]|uniref:TetR family transcriptional regulator n=1 Tax=Streptomyces sp. NPDC001381 TaxID=3364567 RepID=UPI0036CCD54B